MYRTLLPLILFALFAAGCRESAPAPEPPAGAATLVVTSAAFVDGGEIPLRYTCDGDNRSVPLRWSGLPDATGSVVIVMDDPDAPGGRFTHWLAANLPAASEGIATGASGAAVASAGGTEGMNDFGEEGYGGPCPPAGNGAHTYEIRVYALDAVIFFGQTPSRGTMFDAIDGHILASGLLTGVYSR